MENVEKLFNSKYSCNSDLLFIKIKKNKEFINTFVFKINSDL